VLSVINSKTFALSPTTKTAFTFLLSFSFCTIYGQSELHNGTIRVENDAPKSESERDKPDVVEENIDTLFIGSGSWTIESSKNNGAYKYGIRNGILSCYSVAEDTLLLTDYTISATFLYVSNSGNTETRSVLAQSLKTYLFQSPKWADQIHLSNMVLHRRRDSATYKVCSFVLRKL